jgi:hypothetical protein
VPKLVKHLRFKNGREEKGWEVLVGDQSGSILLTLTEESIISQIRSGTSITLRNALIYMHENKYMRVAINKWGKIDLSVTHTFQPSARINRSLDEYMEKTE